MRAIRTRKLFFIGILSISFFGLSELGTFSFLFAKDDVDSTESEAVCDFELARPEDFALQNAEYKKRLERLQEKMPHIARAFSDPQGFLSEMRGRFEEQKKWTPENPREFPVYDVAEPSLIKMRELLEKRADTLAKEAWLVKDTPVVSLSNILSWVSMAENPNIPFYNKHSTLKDVRILFEFFKQIQEELDSYIEAKSISYQKWLEVSYFFSRSMVFFKLYTQKIRDRLSIFFDRTITFYWPYPPEVELERYKKRQFFITNREAPSMTLSNRISQMPVMFQLLDRSFYNTDELEFFLLPLFEDPEFSGLELLAPHEIFLLGLTDGVIPADGFTRPPGDFYNHDITHAAHFHFQRYRYLKHFGVEVRSEKHLKIASFQNYLDIKYHEEMEKIEDFYLKASVRFLYFFFHHKIGRPALPSSYLVQYDPGFEFAKRFYKVLVSAEQGHGFKPKMLEPGFRWARNFFAKYRNQEMKILGVNKMTPYLNQTATLD